MGSVPPGSLKIHIRVIVHISLGFEVAPCLLSKKFLQISPVLMILQSEKMFHSCFPRLLEVNHCKSEGIYVLAITPLLHFRDNVSLRAPVKSCCAG